MVYSNRILRIWVFDALDYFVISAFLGSIVASQFETYFSEKESMEGLKEFIINKSRLIPSKSSKTRILNPKDDKIRRIFKLAQDIEKMLARLPRYLKERELKGVLKIF